MERRGRRKERREKGRGPFSFTELFGEEKNSQRFGGVIYCAQKCKIWPANLQRFASHFEGERKRERRTREEKMGAQFSLGP